MKIRGKKNADDTDNSDDAESRPICVIGVIGGGISLIPCWTAACIDPRMKLTGQIIGAAMEVHTVLGPGFLESVYHCALVRELSLRGLSLETEQQI